MPFGRLGPYPKDDDVIGTGRPADRGRKDLAFAWRINPKWDRWLNSLREVIEDFEDASASAVLALAARVLVLEGQMSTVLATLAAYVVAFSTGTLTAVVGVITTLTVVTLTVVTLTVTTLTVATLTVTTLLNLTGGQIQFPATQVPSADAQTLDDYEEGLAANGASWTPALLFGGAATGMTYSAQGGWYSKIGREVLVVGRFTLTAKGSSTGSATISGLPFAAHTDTPVPSMVGETITAGMAALTSNPTVRVTNGASVLDLHDCGATGVAALDDTNFTNTSVFTFSLKYLAAA